MYTFDFKSISKHVSPQTNLMNSGLDSLSPSPPCPFTVQFTIWLLFPPLDKIFWGNVTNDFGIFCCNPLCPSCISSLRPFLLEIVFSLKLVALFFILPDVYFRYFSVLHVGTSSLGRSGPAIPLSPPFGLLLQTLLSSSRFNRIVTNLT